MSGPLRILLADDHAMVRQGLRKLLEECPEWVAASRVDEDGVLILSEFAGAATELQGAVTVNPYDVHALAETLQRSLHMPVAERRARIRALRRRVCSHDVFAWAEEFLQRLQAARGPQRQVSCLRPGRSVPSVLAEIRQDNEIRLLLDYDGTLVPLARSPELAVPDRELLVLLERLATSRGIAVDIVSGRPRDSLARWFGHLPIGLLAEHGFWRRRAPGEDWDASGPLADTWMDRVRPILEQFVDSTPGAHLELKTASMAWHYRGAARDFGGRQAHELRLLLGDLLSNQPVEVLEGKKVIEVRLRGVSKAMVVQRIQPEVGDRARFVAIGDDHSDDELFRALPASAISIGVGHLPTAARFNTDDHRSVRRLLSSLVNDDAFVSRYAAAAVSA